MNIYIYAEILFKYFQINIQDINTILKDGQPRKPSRNQQITKEEIREGSITVEGERRETTEITITTIGES